MKLNNIYILCLGLFIISCGNNKEDGNYSAEEMEKNSADLNIYFDKEFQKEIEESPMMQTRFGMKSNYGKWDDFSNLKYAEDLEQAKKRLEYLDNIDASALNEETKLSYELFRRQVKNEIDDYKYRFYDYPVNQMHGYHAELPLEFQNYP